MAMLSRKALPASRATRNPLSEHFCHVCKNRLLLLSPIPFRQLHKQQHHTLLVLKVAKADGSPAAAVAAAPAADIVELHEEEQLTESQACLNAFLVWLVANDVQGIGLEDSAVALCEDDDGERGLIALKAIRKGDVVFRVPLRLALTDHAQDEESNKLVYEDAPWSVRLATKLLREESQGPRSPWYPYIRVLPARVPAPLEVFSWEDMQQVEWPPAQAAIYDYNWLVTGAYTRAAGAGPDPEQLQAIQELVAADARGDLSWMVDPDRRLGSPAPSPAQIQQVLGGANAEHFQWAMSVVHSRTFANAARGGGVGVRMLVPLVDMLNHAGDVTASGRMDDMRITPTDNVRWDVVAPDNSPQGWWEMVVSATADVREGAPLQLSYGERASDDFFLHYGFVPPLCNPHEDAVMFEDAEEALEWHLSRYATQMSQEEAEEVYARAYTAALEDQKRAAAPKPTQAQGQQQAEGGKGTIKPPKGWEKLKVYSAGRVDGALMTAFTTAMGGDTAAAERAVGERAQQLLEGMRTSLLLDLLALVQDAAARGDKQEERVAGDLLMQQVRQQREVEAQQHEPQPIAMTQPAVTQPTVTPAVKPAAPAAAAATSSTAVDSGWWEDVDGQRHALPPRPVAQQIPVSTTSSSSSNSSSGSTVTAPGISIEHTEAIERDHKEPVGSNVEGRSASMNGGEGFQTPSGETLEEVVGELGVQAEARHALGGVPPLLTAPLTPTQLLCVRFRAAKKIVLWGVVHRAWCGTGQGQASVPKLAATTSASVRIGQPDALAGLPRRLGKQAVPML